jgi:hypothetical protein
MADDLAQLMRSATEGLVLPPEAASDAITGFHRKRRRRLAAAAVVAAGAVAAAVALPLATTDSSGRHDINRVVPASPSATIVPLASVSGVDVTYLPPGFVVQPDYTIGAMLKENGHTSVSQYYRPTSGGAGGKGPELSLAVQRGYTADLDAFAAGSKGSAESWTTLAGKRALLQTFPAGSPSAGSQAAGYELTWVAGPDVTVTVFSSGPLSLREVKRVAEGLVVHPGDPGPADRAAATDAIRDVVRKAFDGGQPADVSMSAIENGQQLSSVLAQLKRVSPAMTQAAAVTAVHVTFVAANQAVAQTSISYPVAGPANVSTVELAEADVTVDFTDGRWLVSQSSYCSVVSALVHGCPTG